MGLEQISIAPAGRDDDLAGIAALAGRIWRRHYPGIISHAQIDYMLGRMYDLETLRAETRDGGIAFYQLLVDSELSGFASIGPAPAADTFKLHKLYVLPESHGRGFGWRLLNHCEREAIERGARRLELAVNRRNEQAIAFYQRNGFAIRESTVSDIGGGFVMDDFIMEKDCS